MSFSKTLGDNFIEISPNGNVGIGSTLPTQKLDVGGNIKAQNATFTGNVGIGSSVPAAKLDVLGDIKASGTVSSSTLKTGATIAIGTNAGKTTQGAFAIGIGDSAGGNTQGANAIAIGYRAGQTNQAAQSIIINATTTPLNNTAAIDTDACFIKPIKAKTGNGEVLMYNDSTGEIIRATQAVLLPYGGSNDRPTSASEGHIRYNTDVSAFEGYSAGEWSSIGSGGGWTGVGTSSDIYSIGNVGIGISNPGAKLDVLGNMRVTGNVGIGSLAPAARLDVLGNIKATDALFTGTLNIENAISVDGSSTFKNTVILSDASKTLTVAGTTTLRGLMPKVSPKFITNTTIETNTDWPNDGWAVSTDSTSFPAYKAFNKIIAQEDYWISGNEFSTSTGLPAGADGGAWLMMQFPEPYMLQSYAWAPHPNDYGFADFSVATEWKLQGSTTGQLTDFTTVGSYEKTDWLFNSIKVSFDVPAHQPYKYWRVFFTKSNNKLTVSVADLEFTTKEITALIVEGKSLFNENVTLSNASKTLVVYGNVGIGSSIPAAKLDVLGNIKATDALFTGRLNVGIGGSSTTVTGPFMKQGGWTPSGSSHTISNFFVADNCSGNILINVKSEVLAAKLGSANVSFVKTAGSPVDLLIISQHTNANLGTFTIAAAANNTDITVGTDANCRIYWTSTGAY